jgi:hypothetical protein
LKPLPGACGPPTISERCDTSDPNTTTPPADDGQAELFFDEAEVLAGLPAEERDALIAARAEGALGLRDDVDQVRGRGWRGRARGRRAGSGSVVLSYLGLLHAHRRGALQPP